MFEKYRDIVTVKELCEMLCIGKNTAYDLVRFGQIQVVFVKTQIRIPKENIIRFVNRKSIENEPLP